METKDYVFELRIARVPKTIDESQSLPVRVKNRAYNWQQKNTFGGLVKMLAHRAGIVTNELPDNWLDDTTQIIQVEGTKEFCEEQQRKLEGMSDEDVKVFFENKQENRTFIDRLGDKLSIAKAEAQGKGFFWFQNYLAAGGILISCDVRKK